MRLRPGVPAALLLAVLLGGCATPPGPAPSQDGVGPLPAIAEGKGAISGLVIDDRYRPVPDAFVLLAPLGLTATSDAQGQFLFTDLEPGAYVLQASAQDHEAAPRNVDVVRGQYAEAEVQARRLFGGQSDLVTTQVSIFIPCAVSAIVVTAIADCLVDLSGDSYRVGFSQDYTPYGKNATNVVVEFLASQDDGYLVPLGGCGHRYDGGTFEGTYIRYWLIRGNVTPDHAKSEGYDVWRNDCKAVGTTVFYVGHAQALVKQYTGLDWGVGARVAVKATFLTSLFVGEPLVDLAEYGPLRPA